MKVKQPTQNQTEEFGRIHHLFVQEITVLEHSVLNYTVDDETRQRLAQLYEQLDQHTLGGWAACQSDRSTTQEE